MHWKRSNSLRTSRARNMVLHLHCTVFSLFLSGVAAFNPVPRTSWKYEEVHLIMFQAPGVFNYSTMLLKEDSRVLYVGAREAIFALNVSNIAEKQQEVSWIVTDEKKNDCVQKGKSRQTECLNYIRVLQKLNDDTLFVCGTYAFQPTCDYLTLKEFKLEGKNEDGKARCPFDPAQSYTSVMVDGELYSGTTYNFLGSEPIIYRNSQQASLSLRTEYAVPWLNEPSFVFADVIKESQNSPDGDDDKIYFFFTEVAVEYDFIGKLMIPRIARVCKGDQGGQRTLQRKWTSFLKARLVCSLPESKFIFNTIHDVFTLKTPNWKETVFYGVFTSQWNNVAMSAVCAFNMSTVEEVFSRGKYMHSAPVEQSPTKWVRYNGPIPAPRPGACITHEARALNYSSSLHLPDKTLQFVKDRPLMDDPVTSVGNGPKLVKKDVNYTQIIVDRVRALDGNTYDVMFIGTDKGALHKALSYDNEMHIITEVQLFPNFEPVQALEFFSNKDERQLYAGSNAGVVQFPVAFCEKYTTCLDCILARDPYCAWDHHKASCVNVLREDNNKRRLIQNIDGNATVCPGRLQVRTHVQKENYIQHTLKPGSAVDLKCSVKSKLANVVWKFNSEVLTFIGSKYHVLPDSLLVFNVSEEESGLYECLAEEQVKDNRFSQVVAGYVLNIESVLHPMTTAPTVPTTQTEASPSLPFTPIDTFSLPPVRTGFLPSPPVTQPEVWSSAESAVVMWLPPLLSDQAQSVSSHGTFHLFCQATGSGTFHIVWGKNGEQTDLYATEQSHPLTGGRVHTISWIKDSITADTEYQCSVSTRGKHVFSKVIITVQQKEVTVEDSWSEEFMNWRSAISDHEKLMKTWKKSLERCEK
ncbi:semaphorin-4D isoform X2 [Latimeria chalumnae]|uniref:Semaphorin 4D n=1 Tax=Latimeria chalumnae TaxID=7897 RepID=H3A306_LATCH|nr:PREDICTED: semaphorin-4D isoform X1 [Latimeria chalumnae]|eukprot:XP_014349611.1 PREDICTED: semaphorin-4D isoform X1 [Latimeria chalumnae]